MKQILFALTLTATTAFAQQPAPAAVPTATVDVRFNAWLGCWRLDDDLSGTGARMCITPEKQGVRMQTLVDRQKGIDELVIADGAEHQIVDSNCKGTDRSEFSKDNARLFRTSEVLCGNEPPRIVKSIVFMQPGPSWILVQHVSGSAASTSVRVQRYRRAANQTLADGSKAFQPNPQATSAAVDTGWSTDDVIEASGKMPAEAIQAALTEVHQKFDLNKKTLIALDKGGVHDSVIDLMVALTYPNKFVVKRAGEPMSTPSGVITSSSGLDLFMAPMLMGVMADCYSAYGYGYRSYYNMCGWYPYSSYYSYYGYGYPGYPYYGWVDVGGLPPGTGSGGGGVIQPVPEGRAVNNRGYTQIHDRQAEPPARVSHSGNGSGWAGSGGTASSGGYSSGSASGASSGGGSGGGGGDSGARVAVPKGGGGN